MNILQENEKKYFSCQKVFVPARFHFTPLLNGDYYQSRSNVHTRKHCTFDCTQQCPTHENIASLTAMSYKHLPSSKTKLQGSIFANFKILY